MIMKKYVLNLLPPNKRRDKVVVVSFRVYADLAGGQGAVLPGKSHSTQFQSVLDASKEAFPSYTKVAFSEISPQLSHRSCSSFKYSPDHPSRTLGWMEGGW